MAISKSTNKLRYLSWGVIALVVIVLDQLTKYWALKFLTLYQAKPILPFFNLTLLYNKGAAFSFLSEHADIALWLFSSVALVTSVIIIAILSKLSAEKRWLSFGLALVLGGALGNVIDRFTLGHVVDFLDFYYNNWHFPAFNLADSAISIGATLCFITLMFEKNK